MKSYATKHGTNPENPFYHRRKVVDTYLSSYDIPIEGYDMKTIGYHCALLYDAGLVADYSDEYSNDELDDFRVGRLTWDGHELLDKIKNDKIWNKTKDIIKKRGIPFVLDAVKEIATAFTSAMIQAAVKNM